MLKTGGKQDDKGKHTSEKANGLSASSPYISGEMCPFAAGNISRRQSPDVGDIFRKATRPVVTVIFAATLAQVVTQGIDAPEWATGLMMAVILWWFGDRTLERAREKK